MKRWFRVLPGGTVSEVTAEAQPKSLSWLQGEVGGLVEHVQLDGRCELWCHEEGKLIGLPLNPLATLIWELFIGRGTDQIVGTVLFTFVDKPSITGQLALAELERRI